MRLDLTGGSQGTVERRHLGLRFGPQPVLAFDMLGQRTEFGTEGFAGIVIPRSLRGGIAIPVVAFDGVVVDAPALRALADFLIPIDGARTACKPFLHGDPSRLTWTAVGNLSAIGYHKLRIPRGIRVRLLVETGEAAPSKKRSCCRAFSGASLGKAKPRPFPAVNLLKVLFYKFQLDHFARDV